MDDVLDRAVLEELLDAVGGDTEFLADLIDTFFDDAPQLFEQMDQALSDGQSENFRRAAHSLKSNAANFGARNLAEMAKELEEQGKTGDLVGGSESVAHMSEEYDRVKVALTAVRDRGL